MNKTVTFLALWLHGLGAYAQNLSEQTTTETHASLWLTFQTSDRFPTARTAKKMTAEGLQNCRSWRLQAQKKFSARISKLPECENSDGICASKGICATYWATEVTFKNPLTLVNRTRSFTGPQSKPSMEACLKWTHEIAEREGARFFWSTCSYEDPSDEKGQITGHVESLLDLSLEPHSRLLKHHQIQAQAPNVKFKQHTASSTAASFPFNLQKSRAEATDPEFKSSLAECENWRTSRLKKFEGQSKGIDGCKLSGSACQLSNPPTCYFSHDARIAWKVPRTIYLVQREFSSSDTTSQGFEACRRWLKDEEEFAQAETIDGKCLMSGSRLSGGKTTYTITGSIHQIDQK